MREGREGEGGGGRGWSEEKRGCSEEWMGEMREREDDSDHWVKSVGMEWRQLHKTSLTVHMCNGTWQ